MPGKVSLDASHVARFVNLGAAPVLALLALQFPAFGHFVARWIGPVLGALKPPTGGLRRVLAGCGERTPRSR